ncbi:hypothetical protein BJ742DRAFT_75616 [Cladochytrium replicatum]|nr:hypothetical protein BJ742DRAFT_75616 [Cladochytrium replicatum]
MKSTTSIFYLGTSGTLWRDRDTFENRSLESIAGKLEFDLYAIQYGQYSNIWVCYDFFVLARFGLSVLFSQSLMSNSIIATRQISADSNHQYLASVRNRTYLLFAFATTPFGYSGLVNLGRMGTIGFPTCPDHAAERLDTCVGMLT